MPSPLFTWKNKLTFDLRTLRDVPARVPVLFALLAFLAGYGRSAYSHRVSNLFANRGEGVYCVQNCDGAYESWYRNNQDAAAHAHLIPAILMFGFPVAMTLATVFAMSLAWLPNLRIGRLLPGLGVLYCGSVATAVLAVLSFSFGMSAFFFPVALALGLLALAVYLYSPVLARAVLAGRDASIRSESGAIFLAMSASIPLGLVIGEMLHWLFPAFILTYGIQVAMGGLFGASLALPGRDSLR